MIDSYKQAIESVNSYRKERKGQWKKATVPKMERMDFKEFDMTQSHKTIIETNGKKFL